MRENNHRLFFKNRPNNDSDSNNKNIDLWTKLQMNLESQITNSRRKAMGMKEKAVAQIHFNFNKKTGAIDDVKFKSLD